MANKNKEHKIHDWIFDKIPTIIVWILGIIAIYWILLTLTNHSPTLEQLGMVVLGILTTLVFKHNSRIGELMECQEPPVRDYWHERRYVSNIE